MRIRVPAMGMTGSRLSVGNKPGATHHQNSGYSIGFCGGQLPKTG